MSSDAAATRGHRAGVASAAWRVLRHQVQIIGSSRPGTIGALIVAFFALVAILAPWLAPHDPWESLYSESTGKIASLLPPTLEFPLGTTLLGRDLLSQMIYGCQATMLIGLTSGLIAILIGANIGLYSGYYGGRVDEVLLQAANLEQGNASAPTAPAPHR